MTGERQAAGRDRAQRARCCPGQRRRLKLWGRRIEALLGTTPSTDQAYIRGHPINSGVLGDFANASAVELLARGRLRPRGRGLAQPLHHGCGARRPQGQGYAHRRGPDPLQRVHSRRFGDSRRCAGVRCGHQQRPRNGGGVRPDELLSNEQAQAAMQASRLRPSVPDHEPAHPLHPDQVLSELDKILPREEARRYRWCRCHVRARPLGMAVRAHYRSRLPMRWCGRGTSVRSASAWPWASVRQWAGRNGIA